VVPILQATPLVQLDEEKRASVTNEYRKTVAQAATGLLAVVGFFVTYQQIQSTFQKDISDRLAKAIEATGSSNVALRAGGVYTLGRIMRDSPQDSSAILQILSAFVRSTAAMSNSHADPGAAPIDVSAALLVITNRPISDIGAVSATSIDLRGSDLHQLTMRNANLDGAILIGCSFEGAGLAGTTLKGADLSFANLDGAVLRQADLSGANLLGASLRGTVLSGANLTSVENLTEGQLSRAIYDSAKLPSNIKQEVVRGGRS
jgi:uncharacterized protein YjbI with pentapeptide repeats